MRERAEVSARPHHVRSCRFNGLASEGLGHAVGNVVNRFHLVEVQHAVLDELLELENSYIDVFAAWIHGLIVGGRVYACCVVFKESARFEQI